MSIECTPFTNLRSRCSEIENCPERYNSRVLVLKDVWLNPSEHEKGEYCLEALLPMWIQTSWLSAQNFLSLMEKGSTASRRSRLLTIDSSADMIMLDTCTNHVVTQADYVDRPRAQAFREREPPT